MIQVEEIKHATARQAARLFEDILATLPAECASLEIKRNKDGSEIEVSRVPANTEGAEFGAMIFSGVVYSADFGKAPTFTFEFPWEVGLSRKAGFDQQLAVVKRMCLAVIAGKCEHGRERFGTLGSVLISDNEVYRATDHPLLAIFRRRHNLGVTRYAPYDEDATAHSQSFPRLSL
jgi:hypothetical protein